MGVEILGAQGQRVVPNVNILENLTFPQRFHWLYASDSSAFPYLGLVPHGGQFSYSSLPLNPLMTMGPYRLLTLEMSLARRASSRGSSIRVFRSASAS